MKKLVTLLLAVLMLLSLYACGSTGQGGALTHLTDEDVPQGIAGTWSVHQNLSNSCKGQGSAG